MHSCSGKTDFRQLAEFCKPSRKDTSLAGVKAKIWTFSTLEGESDTPPISTGDPFHNVCPVGGGKCMQYIFHVCRPKSLSFAKAENLRKRYTVTALWKAGTTVGRQKQMAANGPGKVREFESQCWDAFKLGVARF